MTDTVPFARRKNHWTLVLGICIWGFAILWWLAYYGQWDGWFGLLDVKLGCLMGDAFECANFQDFIGPSAIPVYSPWVWYAGAVLVLVGLIISWRKRA